MSPTPIRHVTQQSDGEVGACTHDLEPAVLAALKAALPPGITLLHALGAGAHATVYLGHDRTLGRHVAIKLLATRHANNLAARERFLSKARAMANVQHANVACVYHIGELAGSGLPYFVMRFVEGTTLSPGISPAPTQAQVRRILADVSGAMAAAHEAGVSHVGVRPANIIIEHASGRAVLVDVGNETPDGAPYTSPEQAATCPADAASDVYALGVIGFEMCAGRVPFRRPSAIAILAAHLTETPLSLSAVRPDMHAPTSELIDRCLQKDPLLRPTAREIANCLSHHDALRRWPPPGLERLHGAVHKLITPLAIGSLLVATSLLAVIASPGGDDVLGIFLSLLPGATALVLPAYFGLVLLLYSFCLGESVVREVSAALRQGYRFDTIAEVLADKRGDTESLIAGSGEYVMVHAATRMRLRKARLWAAGTGLIAAAAALFTPILYLVMARLLSPIADAAALPNDVALATLLTIIVCGTLHETIKAYETWVMYKPHRRRRQTLSTGHNGINVSTLWYSVFERSRPRGMSRAAVLRRRVMLVAASTLALIATTGVLGFAATLVTFKFVGGFALPSAMPNLENVAGKMRRVDLMRPLALEPASAVSPQRAGVAMHNLGFSTQAPPFGARPVLAIDGNAWDLGSQAERFFPGKNGRWTTRAMLAAQSGLSRAQRAFLEKAAQHPGRGEFAILTHAAAADLMAPRVAGGIPDSVGLWELPMPSYSVIRNVAAAELAQAALDLSAGRAPMAERRARGVIRAGLVLADAPILYDAIMGSVVMISGTEALAAIRRSEGELASATEIERMLATPDSVLAASPGVPLQMILYNASPIPNIEPWLRVMEFGVSNTASMRALRWEYLVLRTAATCAEPRDLIFGGSERRQARLSEIRRDGLVRYPSERAYFDFITTALDRPIPPSRVQSGVIPFMARQTDRVVGGSRFELCAQILSM